MTDLYRCDGSCGRMLAPDEQLVCLADHSARLGPDAPPYILCASCMAAHQISWEMEGDHAAEV